MVTLGGWKDMLTAVTIVVAAPAGPIRLSATAMVSTATAASRGSLSMSTLPMASAVYTPGLAAGIGYHGLVERGCWADLPRPIVGLSPMDGVTDAVARSMAVRYGRPDLTITEFVAVEGLTHGAVALLEDLRYDEGERPVVAQLYGVDPAAFREAAAIATALGFDAIDVNMGCPASSVARRGAGAALIQTPDHARAIIRAVRAGIADWADGRSLDELVSHRKVRRVVKERAVRFGEASRRVLPVSVKTRFRYAEVVGARWHRELAREEPVAITLHGRTLKQMYSGSADWDA